MRKLLLLVSLVALGVGAMVTAPAPFGSSQASAQSQEGCFEFREEVTTASFAPNCERRRITIIKEVEGDSDATFDFTSFGSGAFHDEDFSLKDGEVQELIVPSDTYIVTELPQEGWSVTAIECQDEDAVVEVDLETGHVILDMNLDPHVVCVFHNTADDADDEDDEEEVEAETAPPNLGGFFAGLFSFLFGGGGQ
jgi:hypothetical protein